MGDHAWDAYSDAVDAEIERSEHEYDRKNGIHTTQSGKKIKISDLEIYHIKNIIKYFGIYDTNSRYYKELRRRGVFWRIIK